MNAQQYEEMMGRQGRACDICRIPFGGPVRACLDHDHATGRPRAILCSWCNSILGHARDDPDILVMAANYLLRHGVTHGGFVFGQCEETASV